MKNKQFSLNSKNLKIVLEKLSRCHRLKKYGGGEETEATRLSYAISELEESFLNCLEKHFPTLLTKDLTEEQLDDLLIEIGEEFKHIIYHIRDSKFYRQYLFNNKDQFVY